METDEAGIQKHYIYGSGINSPDYMILNGENFRLIKDHLGPPRLVISANTGTIVQRMDFNEWGEVLCQRHLTVRARFETKRHISE